MRKHALVGKTVALEIKTYKYEVRQKSITVPYWVETKEDLSKVGKQLLGIVWPVEATRLIGLRVSNLTDKSDIESIVQDRQITDFIKPMAKESEEQKSKSVPKPTKTLEDSKIYIEDTNKAKKLEESKSVELEKKRERSEKQEGRHRGPKYKTKKMQEYEDDVVKLDRYFTKVQTIAPAKKTN